MTITITIATQRRFLHSTDTVPKSHAEAPQANVSEGLAQGPYVAARAGVESMTIRLKGVDSTNVPPNAPFMLIRINHIIFSRTHKPLEKKHFELKIQKPLMGFVTFTRGVESCSFVRFVHSSL